MELHTLITAGFLGLASGGFDGAGPIPIGTGIGAAVYNEYNTSVVWSQLAELRAPAGPNHCDDFLRQLSSDWFQIATKYHISARNFASG